MSSDSMGIEEIAPRTGLINTPKVPFRSYFYTLSNIIV
jgi:hypothetical protein